MPEGLNDKEGWSAISVALPPELSAIGVAPDLQRFFDAMVYKLRRNAHKGRWEDVPLNRAFEGIEREAAELKDAIAQGSTMEILMEAADVANQALIAANIGLEAAQNVQPQPATAVIRPSLADSPALPHAVGS